MATEIILRKLYDSFVPVDKSGLEVLRSIAPNSEMNGVLIIPDEKTMC